MTALQTSPPTTKRRGVVLSDDTAQRGSLFFVTGGDNLPSARFRVELYLAGLERLGWRCAVRHTRPSMMSTPPRWLGDGRLAWRTWTALQLAGHVPSIVRAARFDIVVLQREIAPLTRPIGEEWLARRSARLVLDVDDAVHLKYGDGAPGRPSKMEALARRADLVIVGNDELKEQYSAWTDKIAVIPTPVDTERFLPRDPAGVDPHLLVWMGTSSNFPQVEALAPAFEALRARLPQVRLRIVADRAPEWGDALGGVPIEFRVWSAGIEIDALGDAAVGLMPLADTPWNRAKCGAKLLLCMARGLPSVASPVGINARIVDDGVNGRLARSTHDWTEALAELLLDRDRAAALGAAGRATVEHRYSVAACLPRLHELLLGVLHWHGPP